jgi:hypothetical protein
MHKTIALFALLAVNSSTTLAQSWNGAFYSCAVEATGGLAYDATIKKWKGAAFRPDKKFMLLMEYKGRRENQPEYGKETVDDYNVEIVQSGTAEPRDCIVPDSDYSEKGWVVGVWSDGTVENCHDFITTYKFNLRTGRFLSIYAIGYIDGKDDDSNTPVISGGTCTKID